MKKFLFLATTLLLLASCAPALPSGASQSEPQSVVADIQEALSTEQVSLPLSASFSKEDEANENDQPPTQTPNPIIDLFSSATDTPGNGEQTLFALPHQQSNCYFGCSETLFDVADALFADSLYTPISVDPQGDWLNLLGPNGGQSCWLPASSLTLLYNGQAVLPADLAAGRLSTQSCPANPTAPSGTTATQEASSEGADKFVGTPQPEFEFTGVGQGQPGRFARLMHDPQWMEWLSRIADPDWPNGFYYDWYPETVPLFLAPKSGDGKLIYSLKWLEYLREIQPNNQAALWIARVAAGLFNKGNQFIPILNLDDLEELPSAEGISSGGNVVNVLETRSGSARIEMLYNQYSPPDPDLINYYTAPWLVTKFTAVSIDGQLGNPGGIDVYFPNLAKVPEGYWVDLNRVEYFPRLPYQATIRTPLNIRSEPSTQSDILGELSDGAAISLLQYLPQASNVWGRTDGGWILLEYQNRSGVPVYTTSWSMQTRPPTLIP